MTDFDQLVDQAWPAIRRERLKGWWLRHAGGVTKRANSVWPAGDPGDVAAAVEAAERFYAVHGLPPVFSISRRARPGGLDLLLADRGYEVVDPTLIMTAPLTGKPPVSRDVEITDAPSPEWLATWWSVDGRHATGLDTATGIVTGVPARYATTGQDGGTSPQGRPRGGGGGDDDVRGVGRGVVQGDWLGIYCMAVTPRARHRGMGRDVLHALLNDGHAQGTRRAYLCVTERNAAARALYESAGFRVAGAYHYRLLRPATCPPLPA